MDITIFLFFVLGLVLLVAGAEFFVKGASQLAILMGISPLVIGLTIVAYGTSAPELAVTVQSVLKGEGHLALGNVIGSNIANILLILGLAAVVTPIVVSQQLIRLDVPLMVGTSVLALLFCWDGLLTFWEGITLLAGSILYTIFLIYQSRRENAAVKTQYAQEYGQLPAATPYRWLYLGGYILGGMALLVFGSQLLVDSATKMALFWGVSELVIGLTVLSVGTSLPELATSVVASYRGERDIAVGNVVGSNLFNLLMVMGTAGVMASKGIVIPSEALELSLPIMLGVALACLPIFVDGRVPRWVGIMFVGYYITYTVYLVLHTNQHTALPTFKLVVGNIALPVTVILLMIMTMQYWLNDQKELA